MEASRNALVRHSGRVYRCLDLDANNATLVMPEGNRMVSALKVKPMPTALAYHSAFDEWLRLDAGAKEAFIRAAISDNAHMGWMPKTPDKLVRNLAIMDHCVTETAILVRRGVCHYACRTILEVARHHTFLNTTASEFKIDNNMAPDIARLLTVMFPEIPDGFFELRRQRARLDIPKQKDTAQQRPKQAHIAYQENC